MSARTDSDRFQTPPLRRRIRPSTKLLAHFSSLACQVRDWADTLAGSGPVAIGVGGTSRGCGTSTVALNLACGLSRLTARTTGLIEAEWGRPTWTATGRRYAGLSEILAGECAPEQCWREVKPQNLLLVGPGQVPANRSFELNFEALRPLLLEHFQHCPFVVFDLALLQEPSANFSLLRQLHGLLVVVDEAGIDEKGGQRLRETLDRQKTPLLGLVLNKSDQTMR